MSQSKLASRVGLAAVVTCLSTLATLAATPAWAADPGDDAPTAVLGMEALDGAPDAIAAEITDALRQRVAGTKGFQLVQGKDLVEVKLVFSCPDESPACMSQAGKSMGAAKLIFGNVKRAGADYVVSLKLLDVNRGTVETWVSETIPKKKAEPSSFRSLAPAWIAKLLGRGTAGGALQVRANVAGAQVSLDGTNVGVTGTQPVTISDVAPGQHEVTVEKPGYTTTKQEFTLASGQSLPLSLSLSPVSVEVGAPKPETEPVVVRRPDENEVPPPAESGSSRSLTRAGFYVAVVGTLASAALALKFGNDVRQINSQLDPYRRFPCSAPSGLCDVHNNPAQPLSLQDKNIVNSKTNDGNRAQTLQWVFVALAPPFAVAGAYLLYKGYLQATSSEQGSEHASNSHGLRIFPTASASAGGIIAEFDF
jgi:hypothetical protein